MKTNYKSSVFSTQSTVRAILTLLRTAGCQLLTANFLRISMVIALVVLFVNISFGQKAKVQAAYNYLKYEQLDKAKEAIDEAALDDGSMNMDKTWYYRGLIYEQIFSSDKFKDIAPNALDVASLSYRKALEIDPNSEYKGEINTRLNYVKTDLFNAGVVDLRDKKYTTSLNYFEGALKITPNDSLANLYAAYSAERSGNNAKAKEYYLKVIALKSDNAATYSSLSKIYKAEKDTAHAMSYLQEGGRKFPDDLDIMLAEINMYLPMGKNQEIIDLVNKAVVKDPKNASLYFVLGETYDNLANPGDGSAPKPEEKKAYLAKAADAYKKAIEIKPDYPEANFNLGVLYFNQAAEMSAGIDKIQDKNEWKKESTDCQAVLVQAQPYIEKSHDLNPTDHDTSLLYENYRKLKDKLGNAGR